MSRFFVLAMTILLGWIFPVSVVAQFSKTQTSASRDSITADRSLGISFLNIGGTIRHNGNAYTMSLQSPSGNIRLATAGVSVSRRRAVDLPGSYGGELHLDTPGARSLLRNRVKVDSVNIGGIWYQREIWAVYAGMGAWEGVISCYNFLNGQYYSVSLNAHMTLGKPGEITDGGRMSSELLRERVVNILSDGQEPVVQMFNKLLSSFQISH